MNRRWRPLGSLRSVGELRALLAELDIELPCDDAILAGEASPLSRAVSGPAINGKTIGNRWAIHPMEGWDATPAGGVTDDVRRRWRRFGESGAKLICGGEAMAVRQDGRANPRQLIICRESQGQLAELVQIVRSAHQLRYGDANDLVIGFQLTHSGRFCRPAADGRPAPRVAYRHPFLDERFQVASDAQVLSDDEIDALIDCFVEAANVAADAGADFVDVKHCHGYLWHELLSARTRPGRFGGSFENRTRPLRAIVAGIRAAGNPIDLAVRLSLFDAVPHQAAADTSSPGKAGLGAPVDVSGELPYRYGFGLDPDNPARLDLNEPLRFVALCEQLGVKILNASAGSPYYCPHVQRPAAYPPSDGYQIDHNPLVDVARLIQATRQVKASASPSLLFVGTGYSYLQEFLPHVAQAAVRDGWVDLVGVGRMVLSYPQLPHDVLSGHQLDRRLICRTFSDCTTAPRNGLPSGCYPLDKYYAAKEEAGQLKELKRRQSGSARKPGSAET